MDDAGPWKPCSGKPEHARPGHMGLLAASAESAPPEPDELVAEGIDRGIVPGHGEVLHVPAKDRGEPPPHVRDGVVPALSEYVADLLQFGPQPLLRSEPQ